jgi:hypothetical protein
MLRATYPRLEAILKGLWNDEDVEFRYLEKVVGFKIQVPVHTNFDLRLNL